MKKLKVKLCKGCIEDLKHYNPYIDENGNPVSIDELDIEEVSMKKCENYTVNGIFVNMEE